MKIILTNGSNRSNHFFTDLLFSDLNKLFQEECHLVHGQEYPKINASSTKTGLFRFGHMLVFIQQHHSFFFAPTSSRLRLSIFLCLSGKHQFAPNIEFVFRICRFVYERASETSRTGFLHSSSTWSTRKIYILIRVLDVYEHLIAMRLAHLKLL